MTNMTRQYAGWLDAAVIAAIHAGPVRTRESLTRHFWGHDPIAVDIAISNAIANCKAHVDDRGLVLPTRTEAPLTANPNPPRGGGRDGGSEMSKKMIKVEFINKRGNRDVEFFVSAVTAEAFAASLKRQGREVL